MINHRNDRSCNSCMQSKVFRAKNTTPQRKQPGQPVQIIIVTFIIVHHCRKYRLVVAFPTDRLVYVYNVLVKFNRWSCFRPKCMDTPRMYHYYNNNFNVCECVCVHKWVWLKRLSYNIKGCKACFSILETSVTSCVVRRFLCTIHTQQIVCAFD